MYTIKTLVALLLCWLMTPASAWPIFPWGAPAPVPAFPHTTPAAPSLQTHTSGSLVDASPSAFSVDTNAPIDAPHHSSGSFAMQAALTPDEAQMPLYMPPRFAARGPQGSPRRGA